MLKSGFSVVFPFGEVLRSNMVLRSCLVMINGREMSVNLIVLDMKDFDVILGMDWLSKHRATIDCHQKRLFLNLKRDINSFLVEDQRMSLIQLFLQ